MATGETSTAGPARSLLAGLAVLVVPLAAIALGTLQRPTPAPVAEVALSPAPVEVSETDVRSAQPALAPPAIAAPQPPPPPPVNPLPRWTREDNMNFLLLGVDRRTEDEIYRTDTIVLANVDLRAQRATLISIPRDLVVAIPGFGSDRVNSVYAIGETQRVRGGGLALLRETLERNFGLPVNHYAVIDFNCFRGAVDALGGVTVTVPSRIYDPYYPTDDYGYKTVVFEPGRQWLDGERALEFSRTRYGDTDFGRMRRQQQLLDALREQALQVKSLAALPTAVAACRGLASDLSVFDLVALGAAARDIRPSEIAHRVIDEQLAIPYTAPSGAAVLLPRWDAIRAMVRASIRSTTAASLSPMN